MGELLAGGAELFGSLFEGGAEAFGGGAEALGTGLTAGEEAIATGAAQGITGAAPLGITVNPLVGAEAVAGGAGGLDLGGLLGGAGAALGGIGSAIGGALSPAAANASPAPAAGPGVSSSAGATDPFGTLSPTPSGGVGASSFAPASGVNLGGIAPDATSAAAFAPTNDTFATRAGAATDAVNSGAFDPQGSNYTTFGAAPGAGSTFPAGGTPTATPDLGNFVTQPGAAPNAAAASGFDVSGNPIDPATGSSNPQYSGGGTAAQYDPTGATANTGAAAPATGHPGLMDSISSAVIKNPAGTALAAGGLGYSIYSGQKQSAAQQKLADAASQQSGTASQLANYALTGTVPAGSQAGIDQAIAQAKANAVSNAAASGAPTDPTRNTALAATLAKIDQQGPILAAQIAQQLLTSGSSYAGLSNQLYSTLAQIDQSNKASMGKAIAGFAAALSGNKGNTTIQIGGTSQAA